MADSILNTDKDKETKEESILNLDDKEDTKLKPGDVTKDGIQIGEIDPETGKPFPKEDKSDKDDGEGDKKTPPNRPEFVPEKFWDPDKGEVKLEGVMKSYTELENRLRTTRQEGAPEEYTIEGLPEDLAGKFKEANLSGKQAEAVLSTVKDTYILREELANEKKSIEVSKLRNRWGLEGDSFDKDFSDKIESISVWAKQNIPEAVDNLKSTAGGILAIEAMMVAQNKNNQITDKFSSRSNSKTITRGDIARAIADDRYVTDRDYRKEVEQMASDFAKQNNA